ncbi:MAG TPA: hypothetical protein VGP80_16240 [Gemmatimonadales bacterium]|jgi:hypothetical protein|nr:hypothetical protein [Gemmatimonadales bacterium]
MVNRKGSRRGASTIGCLVTLILFAAAVYYGINIGKVYLRYYQLQDTMRSNARLAPSLTDAVIRRRLLDKVDELHLPPDAQKFIIRRSGKPRTITIETTYTESVSLPLFNHTFVFHPSTVEPL